MAALYPEAVGSPDNLRVMDAFVVRYDAANPNPNPNPNPDPNANSNPNPNQVRYDAAGQASLPVHQVPHP